MREPQPSSPIPAGYLDRATGNRPPLSWSTQTKTVEYAERQLNTVCRASRTISCPVGQGTWAAQGEHSRSLCTRRKVQPNFPVLCCALCRNILHPRLRSPRSFRVHLLMRMLRRDVYYEYAPGGQASSEMSIIANCRLSVSTGAQYRRVTRNRGTPRQVSRELAFAFGIGAWITARSTVTAE